MPVLYAAVWSWLRAGLAPAFLPDSLLDKEAELVQKDAIDQQSGLGEEASERRAPSLSVLIAARNEAAALPHLLAALRRQTLAPGLFEVLVADDHSTDDTAALVQAAARHAPFRLRLLSLPPGATGKKAALAAAEAQAHAPWVVCTDADCRPAPGWLTAYAGLLASQPGLHFISGPVRLTPGGAWFDGVLGLEFAGLVGVGAGCIARGRPTMCNGANLAYRRVTFHEVGGYADNQGLASGDDEFLLHKIHARYPAGVRFLARPEAVVDTAAPATLHALLRQRVRWASKWPHYRSAAPRQLALLVLGANMSLALGLALAVAWPELWPWVGTAWALKLGADAWLLWSMLGLLHRRRWLAALLPLQLLYAPYALAVGLAGQRRQGYRWKDRQVR
ncbi:glycosyltransferase [Siccationidurans ginsengisoli]|nr:MULTISPECIES: glycosyltransferase [unclassified Hymenobacter]MBO2032514.1 glycosyltransferase [Hymenobacter sp. BT559]